MRKKFIISLVILIIIISSSIGFYMLKKSESTSRISKIETYVISDGEKIFINGVIVPERKEDIYLDASKGHVKKVFVKNGQVVKKDDSLFTYNNEQIGEQIAQLNRQVTLSKNEKKRLDSKLEEAKKQLLNLENQVKNQTGQTTNGGSIPVDQSIVSGIESQVSAYKDQIDTLQDQINDYQVQINYLKEKENFTVTAPIDGKVTLNSAPNNLSIPYITIESSYLYISGSVNEKDQPKLKNNQEVEALILATNDAVKGKIISIGNKPITSAIGTSAVESKNSSISYYEVNISLDSQEKLTNGFHVQATAKVVEENIRIPKKSVIVEAGKEFVFKDVDKKLVKQEITCTDSGSAEVTIITGLKENDKIVTNPTADMKEGSIIE